MKIKKISKSMALALVLIAILSGALAYAVIVSQRQVTQTVNVVLRRDFKIYEDFDCTTELTSIAWGDMYRNDALNKTYYVKNLGEATIYIHWNATGLDSNLQMKMFWSGYDPANLAPDNTYVSWTENTLRETLPTSAIRAIRFELTILGSAPEGTVNFATDFYGHDVEVG